MYNITVAITGAIQKLLPMRIVELNVINLEAMDSIAYPDSIVFFSIDSLRRVEESSARITVDGQPYGNTYEVRYRLAVRHQNALANLAGSTDYTSSNLITQILDLGLSGQSVEATRDAYFAGRNTYYLMSIPCIAIVAYQRNRIDDQRINRVIVRVNNNQSMIVDFEEEK